MYTPISILGILKGVNKRWERSIVDDTPVKTLLSNYRKIYIETRVLPDTTIRVLDLEQFAPTYADYTGSIGQMLTDNGDTAAVESTSVPSIETRTARFKDGRQAGYSAYPIHPTLGVNVPVEDRSDLLVYRTIPHTDYDQFMKKCMVSVNGFYHMLETDSVQGIWVKDGGSSLRISGQNQFGIYSFSKVSDIRYYPITQNMLHKRLSPEMIAGTAPEDDFSKIGFVKVDADLTNKSVIMVLGGYMITPRGGILTRVSDNEFQVEFQRLPMVQRYYESNGYIDLSPLGLSSTNNNSTQIDVEELLSDEVLMKYMTLSQSFIVVLDAPELFENRYFVRKTGSPGVYQSYQAPNFPLQVGVGRMPEYWSTQEDGVWNLSSFDSYNRQKLFDTTDPLLLRGISDVNLPFDHELYFGACLVEIGRDLALPA